MTSPLKVPAVEAIDGDGDGGDGGSGWWFSQPNDHFRAQDESQCVKGYEVKEKRQLCL